MLVHGQLDKSSKCVQNASGNTTKVGVLGVLASTPSRVHSFQDLAFFFVGTSPDA